MRRCGVSVKKVLQFQKITIIISMSIKIQQRQQESPVYHFTIRIHNNRPILCSSSSAHSIGYESSGTSSRPLQPSSTPIPTMTPRSVSFTFSPNQLFLTPQCTTIISRTHELPLFDTVRSPLAISGNKQRECQNIQLDQSLIDQLLSLEETEHAIEGTVGPKITLQQMHIQQTQSVCLQNSNFTEDQYSEIVTLTQEERQFFNNFIKEESRRLSDSIFRNVTIQNSKTSQVLQERKKIIRNFFRPKGSFVKDDRTCCNSFNNLDSLADSSKRVSLCISDRHSSHSKAMVGAARQASFNN